MLSEILDDIGCVHIVEDECDLSLVVLRRALKMYKNPSVLNNIGSVYNDLGNYAKALDYHLQALQMKILPEDHLDIGISINNVGLSYDNLEDHDHALIYFIRALQIYQRCLPEIHREVGVVLDNIGVAHREKGNYDEALTYHCKALYVVEHALPPNSITLARTMKNAGIALMERGNANDAEKTIKLYRRAMDIYYMNNLGDASYGFVVLYNMAKYYSWQREYKIAFEHFVEALTIQQKVLPRNHPIILDIRKAFIYLKIKTQSPRKRKKFKTHKHTF